MLGILATISSLALELITISRLVLSCPGCWVRFGAIQTLLAVQKSGSRNRDAVDRRRGSDLLERRFWLVIGTCPVRRLHVQVNPIPSSQCDTEEYRQECPPGELSANLPESAPYSRKAAPTLCWLL